MCERVKQMNKIVSIVNIEQLSNNSFINTSSSECMYILALLNLCWGREDWAQGYVYPTLYINIQLYK